MNKSFKITNETLNKIKEYYKDYEIEANSQFLFKAKTKDFSIQVYTNLTCMFQGNNIDDDVAIWFNPTNVNEEVISHAGSDEVGCGDYFGPIVVASSIVEEKDYEYLYSLGVRDSKMLTDAKILEIAPKIKERVKFATFVLTNKKYNEIHDNLNLNKIKAYLHNFVLYKVISANNFKGKIVVDQFCEEALYYSYLKDTKQEEIVRNIYFTTKAENKFLAVACASIIARYTFLKEIEKIEEKLGCKIILGASDKVDELACKLIKDKGFDFIKDYVKIHYKNTEKVKMLL